LGGCKKILKGGITPFLKKVDPGANVEEPLTPEGLDFRAL